MVTVQEAESIVSANVKEFSFVSIPLTKTVGCISREDVFADRDVPAYDRATMDGIAINSSAWAKGLRQFIIQGVQKAGIPPLSLKDKNTCFEITTGAVLPQGCDCVIPIEDIIINGCLAKINPDVKVELWLNVQRQASQRKKGDLLLPRGVFFSSAQIAVAASVGISKIRVARLPRIAVIGTGDELVSVHARRVKPFQTRESNTYALQAGLELNGYEAARFHIKDNLKTLTSRLREILRRFDVIILSGGVSMGKFDFVPQVLGNLAVKVLFHKVRQRPGGPLLFGKTKSGKPVFALPGNPISSQVCFYRYVLPYLYRASGGKEVLRRFVVLNEPVKIKSPATCFMPVRISHFSDGRMGATVIYPRGSSDYASLSESNGFIELASDTYRFSKGSVHRFYSWVRPGP